jgi:hypothetical protein
VNDNWVAIDAVVRFIAFGTILSSAEFLWQRHLLTDSGLMSWQMGRLRKPWLIKGVPAKLLNYALSYPHILWLLWIRLVLAAFMLLGPSQIIITWWIVSLSTVLCWLSVWRTSYGLDGADQMSYIIYTGLAIAVYAETDRARGMFLWFIALQSCLSYLVAGVAKASSRGWRDGSYLMGICYTQIYGHPQLAAYLSARPLLAKVLSRFIIAWEALFPLVLVVPKPVALFILGSGAAFHIVNGFLMGLNTFIWSFVATYPAVLYCLQPSD